MRSLSIRSWLFLPPILAISLFAIVVFLTVSNFRDQEAVLSEILTDDTAMLKNISDLSQEISTAHVELFSILGRAGEGLDEGQLYDRAKVRLNSLYAIESRLADQPQTFVPPAADQAVFERLLSEFQQYRAQAISSVLMTTVEMENASRYMTRANDSYKQLNALLGELTAGSLARARGGIERINVESRRLSRNLVLLLGATALLSLLVSWLISRRLSRDVVGIIAALSALTRGDTSVDLPPTQRTDEIGEMAQATRVFKQTLTRLNDEIAERRTTAEALAAERNFVAAINNTVGALVVVIDRKGRVVRFNKACEEVTGYRIADVRDKPVWDLLVPESDIEAWKHLVEGMSNITRQKRREASWVTSSGEIRLISWAVTTLRGADGETGYLIGCGVDITDRKDTEERLRQAQKMEAVGQLTGGVAHDFNNLLSVAIGNLELLGDELPGERTAERAQIDAAMRALDRGTALTQRLLAFARRQTLQPEAIDMNGLLVGMMDLITVTLEESIETELVRSGNLWLCEADPGQLENVVLNLVINARDAMPNGGKLTIETANARLDDEYSAAQEGVPAGQYVLLAVTDTGHGMSAEVVKKAYDPFFTTKAVGKGSGLGLSMVYGFVKQSRGHVKIYSEVGEGTTVKVYLPRARGEYASAPPLPDPQEIRARDGETVIVVEDDPDVRTLSMRLLSALGYRVLEAETATVALQHLDRSPDVDLLFTDIILPGGMSGRALAEEVARRHPLVRILFTSGYTENSIVHHGRLDEGVDLLQKPFRKADLARKVRQVLDR